jgi:uncharacterized protein
MTISRADVPTENGARYVRQLVQHWSHKFPVRFADEHNAESVVDLPAVKARFHAHPQGIAIVLEYAADTDADRMEQVVAEHLQRFGFKEELRFNWTRG